MICRPHRAPRAIAPALALCLAAGCDRDEVRSYVVERDRPGSGAAGGEPAPIVLPETPPDGWRAVEAGGPRVASYRIGPAEGAAADMSVTSFPGRAGGLLANLNRWREEVGLGRIGAAALGESVERIEAEAHYFHFVDLDGGADAGRRTLGAMLPLDGETWFFKLSGAPETVGAERQRFLDFVRSLGVPEGLQASAAEAFAAAPGEGDGAGGGGSRIEYTLPEGWIEKAPSTMRAASFSIPREGLPPADVSVIPLGGSGGSDLANIAQWRHQLGLELLPDGDMAGLIEPLEAGGRAFKFVELASEKPLLDDRHKARMLVAFFKEGELTWFFKMLGEDGLVAGNKQAFLEFLGSVKLPSA